MGAVLENIAQWQCVERFSDPNQEIKMVKAGVGLLLGASILIGLCPWLLTNHINGSLQLLVDRMAN